MRSASFLGLCICLAGGASLSAQPPQFDPTRLNTPAQFYTNGIRVDAWNRDDAQNQIVTFWFGKNPKNSLSYRQLIAIRRDVEPEKIYYFDIVARKFVGRYDMKQEKYSLLAPQHRLEELELIEEEWFPPPGEKPAIGELFDPPMDGPPNDDQLMMPPVTMEFPRLGDSQWSGFYTDIGGHRRRKMSLTLNGAQGTFQAADVGVSGDFRDVTYQRQENMMMISGKWSAGNTGGGFQFRIMMMDLNAFQGEYWVGNNRNRMFLWDGKRTSR